MFSLKYLTLSHDMEYAGRLDGYLDPSLLQSSFIFLSMNIRMDRLCIGREVITNAQNNGFYIEFLRHMPCPVALPGSSGAKEILR